MWVFLKGALCLLNVSRDLTKGRVTLTFRLLGLSGKVALANDEKHEANKAYSEANKMTKLCPSSTEQLSS